MTTLPTTRQDTSPAPSVVAAETAAQELVRELVLLIERLSTVEQFQALTGIDPLDVPQLLTDPMWMARLERIKREMETNGELARLYAAKRARRVIEFADEVMRDEEVHPSTRLNAGQTILRAAGAERPPAEAGQIREHHTVIINIGGNRAPLVVSNDASRNVTIDATSAQSAVPIDTG